MFNHMLFLDSFKSVYEMKMNLCCKNPEPFGNLPGRKTFFDGSRLEIDLIKREPNGLRPT